MSIGSDAPVGNMGPIRELYLARKVMTVGIVGSGIAVTSRGRN